MLSYGKRMLAASQKLYNNAIDSLNPNSEKAKTKSCDVVPPTLGSKESTYCDAIPKKENYVVPILVEKVHHKYFVFELILPQKKTLHV